MTTATNLIWTNRKCAFKNRIRCGRINNNENIIDPFIFLNKTKIVLLLKIGQFMFEYKTPVKLNCSLCCEYIVKKNNSENLSLVHYATKMKHLSLSCDFNSWFQENIFNVIKVKLDNFQERDSGKALNKILFLDINISKYTTKHGGSSYIPLPRNIQNKKAVINVQNEDSNCFIWSILAALYSKKTHAERVLSYPQNISEIFNLQNIKFPTPLTDIQKFEKQNNHISINVYGLEFNYKTKQHEIVGPLNMTQNKKVQHVNLLYFANNETTHYTCIRSLSRLLGSSLSKHFGKKWICDRCLQFFTKEEILLRHEEYCKLVDPVKINLPNDNNKWIEFKNYSHKEKHPFTIYADFECLTLPISTVQPNPLSSYTYEYQKHIPCSAGYYLVCSYNNELNKYESFTGENVIEWFLEKLKDIVIMIENIYEHSVPIRMTTENWKKYNETNICHICNSTIDESMELKRKCRDHNHFTGEFRGAACMGCNLNYKKPNFIPVFFHNLTGYDSHLIIQKFGLDENPIQIIPSTEEKYVSFSKKISKMWIRFLDSYRFLNSSLDKLTQTLDKTSLKNLRKYFPEEKEYNLLTRKGIFPYDYLDNWAKLKEEQLPNKELFFSKLSQSHVTMENYIHAQNVWTTFNCATIQNYLDIYLQTDILLLADIFENFRTVSLKAYELDPVYYYTTPGFSWDAMLKYTNIKLELLTDIDMLLFVEKGIRGGISQVCNRHALANNQYMSSYNPEEVEKFIIYFDACNLYGWAMKNFLPFRNFEWLSNTEIQNLDFMNIDDENKFGYLLEVDLIYDKSLHNNHSDFPLCCEKLIPPNVDKKSLPKLMTTLHNKYKYIIHYRNLKQAINLGLKLEKIHRVLKFEQSRWLEKFIDKNTEYRKQATSEFAKNLFKLYNNAIYGKSIESIRNRRNMKLVNKWEGCGGASKLIAKTNFHKCTVYNENLVLIELKKTQILFNKPVYIGMCILELSKVLMYDFHYNYIHNVFNNFKLLYMDTDSFIYEFINQNPYEQIKKDIHKFDTSDFPENNVYGIPQVNKKIVGLFKDENSGKIITEFVGLRSKMYNFTLEEEKSNLHARVKGIRGVVTKTLTIQNYKDALYSNIKLLRTQNSIISKNHNIFSVEENKLTLCARDDKRFIIPCSTDTLAWGHYRIPQQQQNST